MIGYKGKQVRDNLHSYDLVNCFWEFYKKPKSGEVYNIPFDNPKVKHLGGIHNDDLKPSFQNKSYKRRFPCRVGRGFDRQDW